MKKELKFKFNVGEIVKVLDIGCTYAGYIDWFKENGYKEFLERYVSDGLPKKNKQYIVIARGERGVKWVKQPEYPIEHFDIKQLLYAIEDFDTKKVYLLAERGLVSVNKETRLLKGQIKLVAVSHKKKQVIIRWNDGTKTKATCNEKDDFDIKVGFAIAFTRKFFENDKKLERYITLKRPKNNLIIKDMESKEFLQTLFKI
jgi:hypothetical protein